MSMTVVHLMLTCSINNSHTPHVKKF